MLYNPFLAAPRWQALLFLFFLPLWIPFCFLFDLLAAWRRRRELTTTPLPSGPSLPQSRPYRICAEALGMLARLSDNTTHNLASLPRPLRSDLVLSLLVGYLRTCLSLAKETGSVDFTSASKRRVTLEEDTECFIATQVLALLERLDSGDAPRPATWAALRLAESLANDSALREARSAQETLERFQKGHRDVS